jgi:hypothetical protein
MRQKTRIESSVTPNARKLSDIIIEIARIGFKSPFRRLDPTPKSAHILMFLASQAWNREVGASQPPLGSQSFAPAVETMIQELAVSRADLEQQLVSTNWETVVELMQVYKRKHLPGDTRRIAAAGYTPQGTLRVVWE